MSIQHLDRLVFRRQYLLVPCRIECPFIHDTLNIGDKYTLYTHQDLVVNEIKTGDKQLILLGDIFDYEDPGKGNMDILRDLSLVRFDALLKMSDQYSGRFVIILVEENHVVILHDATAARKIFFSCRNGKTWFGSQQHLLAKVLGLQRTENPSKLEFYNSEYFIRLNNSNLGNTTYYDDIKQLMPNHYYDVNNSSNVRFWPLEQFRQLSFNEVAEQCTVIIAGYMKSIANRYKIMLPVTAGGDSRLLMSASSNFKEDVYYYINQSEKVSDDYKDITIPARFFKQLGLDFNVLTFPTEVDPSFEKVYYSNNPIASSFYLPHIYNYHHNYSDMVNLPGNVASSPWGVYHMKGNSVSIDQLTRYYQVSDYEFVKDYYHQWMDNTNDLCKDCKLNVINLFYWEERIANWGNQISLDKDIAQEDFNPLNSRLLNQLFLSLPLKYNNEPDKRLHRQIIMNLWPELMKIPFNPSLKTNVLMLLAKTGLFTPAGRILYRLSSNVRYGG